MNINFLAKLNENTVQDIIDAQLADLIERRGVQDAEVFKACFAEAIPELGEPWQNIIRFSDIASDAFVEYHQRRAIQKTIDDAGDDDTSEE